MSHVYFIQAGNIGPIKIGVAADPKRRLAQLQTSCPTKLRLLFSEDMNAREWAFEEEERLHQIFARSRQHGEWFRFDDDIRWAIFLWDCGVSLSAMHPEDFERDL